MLISLPLHSKLISLSSRSRRVPASMCVTNVSRLVLVAVYYLLYLLVVQHVRKGGSFGQMFPKNRPVKMGAVWGSSCFPPGRWRSVLSSSLRQPDGWLKLCYRGAVKFSPTVRYLFRSFGTSQCVRRDL